MIKAISLEATLALGGGRSAFSRYAARSQRNNDSILSVCMVERKHEKK
jgi:hypothetical protein